MGRQLRRVPLDFSWPLNKPWDGFVSPEWRRCPSRDCENGSTLAAAWLENLVQLILMLGEAGRHERPLHPWLAGLPLHPAERPGSNATELTAGLAGRAPGMLGHDSIDRWNATKAIIKAAGLPDDWGVCPMCHGHAIHPDDVNPSEAWEPEPPPEGEGYQLWETVSEGSPITPVFATASELAHWLVEKDESVTKANSYLDWMRFIEGPGWAPSGMVVGGKWRDGVTGVLSLENEKPPEGESGGQEQPGD